MRQTKSHLWIVTVVLLTLSAWAADFGPLAATATYACPNCNSLMSSDKNKSLSDSEKKINDDRERMGKAYNLSIMLMMPTPFLLAAAIFGMFYWHMKKNNLLGQNNLPQQPPAQVPSAQDESSPRD
jgi:hypothetical protein